MPALTDTLPYTLRRFSAEEVDRLRQAGILPDGGYRLDDGVPVMAGTDRAWHFTVEDYYRMVEAGVLRPDERTELFEGHILHMSPPSSFHSSTVSRIARLLTLLAGERAIVRTQDPIQLGDTHPEPDVALLRPREDFYARAHPHPLDVLLAVEVSMSTLAFDQGPKLAKYAEYGIPEVWIVAPEEGWVEVCRRPDVDRYVTVTRHAHGEALAVEALPGLAFTVADVLGPARS
ncbi:MAG: Uma2 family endonuclease [Bacteroidota bacterium]